MGTAYQRRAYVDKRLARGGHHPRCPCSNRQAFSSVTLGVDQAIYNSGWGWGTGVLLSGKRLHVLRNFADVQVTASCPQVLLLGDCDLDNSDHNGGTAIAMNHKGVKGRATVRWYVVSVFSERYTVGTITTEINSDTRFPVC